MAKHLICKLRITAVFTCSCSWLNPCKPNKTCSCLVSIAFKPRFPLTCLFSTNNPHFILHSSAWRNRCTLTRNLLLLSVEGYFVVLNLNFAHRETPITQTLECKSCAPWCAAHKEPWKSQASRAQHPLQSGHWGYFTHTGCTKISLQKGF